MRGEVPGLFRIARNLRPRPAASPALQCWVRRFDRADGCANTHRDRLALGYQHTAVIIRDDFWVADETGT